MSFKQSKRLLRKTVKKSYLEYDRIKVDSSKIQVQATDPITGAYATVNGYLDDKGRIDQIIYQNFGRPFENGVDISNFITTVSVDVDNPRALIRELEPFLNSPIILSRSNAQSFADTLASLNGVEQDPTGSDAWVSINGGGSGNVYFA